MKAVADGDEVALDLEVLAVFLVRHTRLLAVKVMHGHMAGPVHGGQASSGACLHQIRVSSVWP